MKKPVSFLPTKVNNPRRELVSIKVAELHFKSDHDTGPLNFNWKVDDKKFSYNGFVLTAKELLFLVSRLFSRSR